jgi:hypothetical protein
VTAIEIDQVDEIADRAEDDPGFGFALRSLAGPADTLWQMAANAVRQGYTLASLGAMV